MTKKEILEKYNIKEHQFKHIIKKYKVKYLYKVKNKHVYDDETLNNVMLLYKPKTYWSEDEISLLKKHYQNGGWQKCSEFIDRGKEEIKAKAYSLGLYLTPKFKNKLYRESMKNRGIKKTQKDYKILYNDLMNLNDKNVCYFLGFLWSDGCIKDNRIFMTLIKEDMLNSLEMILPKYGEWNFNDYSYKYRKFNVYCKPYYEWLLSLDYHNKSHVPPSKILSKIPKKNINYFFRGLIDGDGSFPLNKKRNKTSFGITSTYNYDWGFFTVILDKIGIKYSVRNVINKKGNSFSEVRVSRINDVIKLAEYVYGKHNQWDGIGLERKLVKSFWNLVKN